jgi:hypothetical protein
MRQCSEDNVSPLLLFHFEFISIIYFQLQKISIIYFHSPPFDKVVMYFLVFYLSNVLIMVLLRAELGGFSQLEVLVGCILFTNYLGHRYQVSKAKVLCAIFKNDLNEEKVNYMERALSVELGALVVYAELQWDGYLAGLPFGILTFGYSVAFVAAVIYLCNIEMLAIEKMALAALAVVQITYVLTYLELAGPELSLYLSFLSAASLFVWDLVLVASAILGELLLAVDSSVYRHINQHLSVCVSHINSTFCTVGTLNIQEMLRFMASVRGSYDGSTMRRVYLTSRIGGLFEVSSSALLYLIMWFCMTSPTLYWIVVGKNMYGPFLLYCLPEFLLFLVFILTPLDNQKLHYVMHGRVDGLGCA